MSVVLEALELYPIRIPMRHRFRRVDHREAVLIKGPAGWGEFSPFPDYPPHVTTRWLAAALEAACSVLPEPGRLTIPVNVTVPAVAPEVAARLVLESGASTAKVKVGEPGQSMEDEEARLAAVRATIGPEGKIRIDVNAAWDVDTAAIRLASYARFDLEYVEQPVKTLEEMVELRQMIDVPLAADELVRLRPDPLEVAAMGAADILVVKVQPLGGVARTLDIAARAGIPVVVSSALETSIGIYSGLLVASLLPQLPFACGLGTVSLIEGDPTRFPLVSMNGEMEVRRPEPDPELLERWRPDRDRSAELLRKVRNAAEVLT
ncbi:MAG TPA: o-succinylbenzoate synthase [Acidimicrobiia bacterium]|nr:o-succinylbenzoate synthase [Acidimicrobiia bacterium]